MPNPSVPPVKKKGPAIQRPKDCRPRKQDPRFDRIAQKVGGWFSATVSELLNTTLACGTVGSLPVAAIAMARASSDRCVVVGADPLSTIAGTARAPPAQAMMARKQAVTKMWLSRRGGAKSSSTLRESCRIEFISIAIVKTRARSRSGHEGLKGPVDWVFASRGTAKAVLPNQAGAYATPASTKVPAFTASPRRDGRATGMHKGACAFTSWVLPTASGVAYPSWPGRRARRRRKWRWGK